MCGTAVHKAKIQLVNQDNQWNHQHSANYLASTRIFIRSIYSIGLLGEVSTYIHTYMRTWLRSETWIIVTRGVYCFRTLFSQYYNRCRWYQGEMVERIQSNFLILTLSPYFLYLFRSTSSIKMQFCVDIKFAFVFREHSFFVNCWRTKKVVGKDIWVSSK